MCALLVGDEIRIRDWPFYFSSSSLKKLLLYPGSGLECAIETKPCVKVLRGEELFLVQTSKPVSFEKGFMVLMTSTERYFSSMRECSSLPMVTILLRSL